MKPNRKAKFRLERIRVKEVSGVDRPANLEPFLVVKRDDAMADDVKQTEETEKAVPPPPAPAAAPGPPAASAPPQPPAAAKLGPISTAMKDMVLDGAKSIIESVQGIAMAVGEAPTDDNAGAPPELAASFGATIGKLQQLMQAVTPAPAAPPPQAPPPQAPPPAAPAAKSDAPVIDADAIGAALAKAMAPITAELRSSADKLTAAVQVTAAAKVVKNLPVGNGQRGEGEPEPAKAHVWPEDLAESAKKKKAAR